ncbi:MAG: FAD:protein FMN transferase [Candidatus Neomarinimicrobiota bacterium]
MEINGFTMGTTYSIKIADKSGWNKVILKTRIDSLLEKVNRQMSTYLPESEISVFNRMEAGFETPISSGFAEVLNRAYHWNRITDGALNITVMPLLEIWGFGPQNNWVEGWEPPDSTAISQVLKSVNMSGFELGSGFLHKKSSNIKLDLGSIAKGWGVDQIADFIQKSGGSDFLVEIGGEVRAKGRIRGRQWRIGIDNPEKGKLPGQKINSVIQISDRALATSGNYRNYFEFKNKVYAHIIDPRTGYPAESNIVSVTVTGPTCTDADALATALMVLNLEDGRKLIESLDGFEAFWILRINESFETIRSLSMNIFTK